MALSKCIKCDGTLFEMVEKEPRNAAFKVNFIQCASCGGVVGVTEYIHAWVLLQKVMAKLGVRSE
jgi:hypothetical protein